MPKERSQNTKLTPIERERVLLELIERHKNSTNSNKEELLDANYSKLKEVRTKIRDSKGETKTSKRVLPQEKVEENNETDVKKWKARLVEIERELAEIDEAEKTTTVAPTIVETPEKVTVNNDVDKWKARLVEIERELAEIDEAEKTNEGEDIEQILIDDLSTQEQEIVTEAMQAEIPEDFEPEEVKTNIGTFLRNQIVKFTAGLEISKKMKSVVRKLRRGALVGVGILSIWPTTNFGEKRTYGDEPVGNESQITFVSEEGIKKQTSEKIPDTSIDKSTFEQLSPNAQSIYLYSITNVDSTYVIVDKPKAEMYVIGKDKKLIATFPILLGKVKGEQKNTADPYTDSPGLGATTPAGKYRIGRDSLAGSNLVSEKGKVLSIYNGNDIAIHITYLPELKKRTKALNSPDIGDNRLSWGCINVDEKNFDKFLAPNISENAILFVTPDNPNITLDPQNGRLEQKLVSISKQRPAI